MADPVSVRPSWLKLSHDSAVVSEPRLGYPTHTGMIKTEREKISTAELDDVLQRARNQGWTSLALVSPDVAAAHDYLRQLELPAGRTYIVDGLPQSTVRLISKLRQLSSLALVDLQIGADGARARALASLTALTSLHLSNNQIGADGARALASLTALTSLHLSNNQIGDDGARALASLTALTSLTLDANQIGADGARALASLTGLTSLTLLNNQIGADGARALASLTGLTSLNLNSNSIGADGARALASLTGLTSLNLPRRDSEDPTRGTAIRHQELVGGPIRGITLNVWDSTTCWSSKSAPTGRGRWPPSPGSPRSASTTTKSATTERGRCWKSGAIGPPRGIFIIST